MPVRGVPDLIAFYEDEPPRIFDWKVHAEGTRSYDQQLLIYALALARSSPHRDFPTRMSHVVEEIRVTECQLLVNNLRNYSVTAERVTEVEEFIAESILEMGLSGATSKLVETNINDFETARFPSTCQSCVFKKICWSENHGL